MTLPVWNNLRAAWRAPAGERRLRVVLGGDVCPMRPGEKMAAEGRAAEVLRELRHFIDQGDIRAVQWETPTASVEAPIRKSGPNLNATPQSAALAVEGGFDVALLANNHIGDHGDAGVVETLKNLRGRGLSTVGAGADLAEATAALRLERAGLRVAMLNFAENEFGAATATRPGAAPQSPIDNLRQTREAAADADLVIVALHGGHEHNPFPSPRLQALCRAFADAGADLVFNCHTHCPGGVEIHDGAPIVYSPGNLYFPSWTNTRLPVWDTGYLVGCDFDAQGAFSLELLPYRFDAERVTPLDAGERGQFAEYLERLCAPLDDAAELRRLFEGWATNPAWNYFGALTAPSPAWREDGTYADKEFERLLGLRNLFTCESHTDVLRTALKLIEEGRAARAAAVHDTIESFQSPPWISPRRE